MKVTKELYESFAFHAQLQSSESTLDPNVLNIVRGLRFIFNKAKVISEFLRKGDLFFLSTNDIRMLMSLRALMIRKPLRKIRIAT